MARTETTNQGNPGKIIIALSAIQVIYFMSLPVLANYTVVPRLEIYPQKFSWLYFGGLGLPLVFAGMKVFNPFPLTPFAAFIHVFLMPAVCGFWWWIQEGTLIEYFAVLLIFEAMVLMISMFLMSFLPIRYYDPDNPGAKGVKNYLIILLTHGFLFGGGFIAALTIVMWRWYKTDPFWQHPFTIGMLLIASVEYIWRNVQYQRNKEETPTLSIEPLLIFAPLPWFISWAILAG